MISQKCPKCHSRRIRRGYRPTPFLLKCLFRFNLLCDTCNWEFVGFAVPGTLSTKSKKKKKVNPPAASNEADGESVISTGTAKAEEKSVGKTVNSLF
jgi:hypothetical protein